MKKSKVAILGSNSHIAKGLISNFLEEKEIFLHLYTREPYKVVNFLKTINKKDYKNFIVFKEYKNFVKSQYDAVINCIGVGTMKNKGDDFSDYFIVTEKYDNFIIERLLQTPNTLYISFSSGVVYGRELLFPAEKNTVNSIRVNSITTEDYYAIARLNAETKHRAFKKLNIVDLRIFSYFSRFIDLADGYFITEAINSILNKKVFITDNVNIVRDYIHPKDLFLIIKKCINTGNINAAFDVVSAKSVEKIKILDYFSLEYGLKYKIKKSLKHFSPTGLKNIYCSNYNNTSKIGFKPVFSSMDTIKEESKYILKKH